MRRFSLVYVLPILALLALAFLPHILGVGTLHLRDVLTSHYPLKASQALALHQGELPLVDLHRGGGQPLLGNPNALPLYPTNLLYLLSSPLDPPRGTVAPSLWALNAHFWIHLLLAPGAFYLLGRAWGLSRQAAWAAGTCYALSGFLLSQLNFYNLVGGAVLAPVFIAAVLHAWRGPSRWTAAAGGLWALLLLAGDPFYALLAAGMAGTAALVLHRSRPTAPLRLLLALASGSAAAAPQWVEFLRILPLSYRGHWKFSPEMALAQSFDPRTAIEWVLPFFFGLPDDPGFWGREYYGGLTPLFFSLSPGVLAIALVLAAPRRRPSLWPWCAVAGGIFMALGSWNPVVRALYHVPGAAVLRFPIKFWLVVAVGASLLCGLGFQRLLDSPALGRRARRLGALLLLLHAASQLWLLRPLYEPRPSAALAEPPAAAAARIPPGARVVHGSFQDLFGPQRFLPGEMPPREELTAAFAAQLYPFAGVPRGLRYELNHSPEWLDSFLTLSLSKAVQGMDDVSRLRILRASGVDVLLLDRPLDLAAWPMVHDRTTVPTPLGDLRLYDVRQTAPPAFLARTVLRAPHMNAALAMLTHPSFDPTATAVLPGNEPPSEHRGGSARLVRDTADEILVDVEPDGAGVLVVQRTFHAFFEADVRTPAGWQPAAVRPANVHRLAVPIPADASEVRIRADRVPTRLAFGVALLGLLGLLGLGLVPPRTLLDEPRHGDVGVVDEKAEPIAGGGAR